MTSRPSTRNLSPTMSDVPMNTVQSGHAMRDEALRLLALADALVGDLPEGHGAFLQPWRGQVRGWLTNPKLESLDGERALDALALNLRFLWLRHAHGQSARYLMSPPHRDKKILPNRNTLGFPYDRWLKPEFLEQRLSALHPAPAGWLGEAVILSSGMAAISAFLQYHRALVDKLWDRPRGPVTLHWHGGYFEIARTLQLICNSAFQARRHAQPQTLFDSVAKGLGDVVLLEPVAADIGLEVFDLDALIAAWRQRSADRPCVVVVDTSLVGDAFPMHRLCRELGPTPPAMVVQIRSGLKLDQAGLELGNVGLVNLFMPATDANHVLLARVADSLRQARTTLGVGPSHDTCAALSTPFFLNPQEFTRHAQAVFANNAAFAKALAPLAKPSGGLIGEVIHPSLSSSAARSWAVAPYVNLRYASDGEGARAFLATVLEQEGRERNLCFRSGSSFGFRSHRFEMGFVRGIKFDSLRVALGSRAGPSLDGVIRLFQDLAAYPDFAALRRAYPQIDAQHPAPPGDEGT